MNLEKTDLNKLSIVLTKVYMKRMIPDLNQWGDLALLGVKGCRVTPFTDCLILWLSGVYCL